MGVFHYAVNTQNKTYYSFGKNGRWYELDYDKEFFQDQELLELNILDIYGVDDPEEADCWSDPKEREKFKTHIHTRVAPDLFEFAKDTPIDKIHIINDLTDDLWMIRVKRYGCVGCEWYEKGSKEYLDEMRYLNRHLNKEDPWIWKRFWSEEARAEVEKYDVEGKW